ncbi:MAG: TolB family protein, partial [Gaiellaceae bacterium]
MRPSTVLAIGILAIGAAAGSAPATPAVTRCNGLLAFASNHARDANPQIYRITLDGGRTDVGGSLEGDSRPQPSPDGSRLAFWSGRPGGGLLVSDADGSHPRRMSLANGVSYADSTVAWSPDSTRLATTTDDTAAHVEVFDATTGVGSVIAAGWSPQWSPDGSRIAFLGYDGVSVARPDGSERQLLAQGTEAVWSPEWTRLLVGGAVVPVAGGSAVSLGQFQGFAWTPDAARILAYATTPQHAYPDLWSVAADGSDPRLIALGATGAALSPDGRKLVFLRRADSHILITDLDGQPLRDLGVWDSGAYDLHMVFTARWSPDGTKVLYWSGNKAVVADVESEALRTLAGGSTESADDPVWSPDGRSVLVTLTDTSGNTDIYVARPDGTHVRAVYVDSVPEGGPSWSPDGRVLAFVRYGKTPTLVVSNLTGRARIVLRRETLV